MQLVHATGMQAGYTMGMQPDGRELLVVVVKGTFAIPQNGEEAALAEEQLPLAKRRGGRPRGRTAPPGDGRHLHGGAGAVGAGP